MTIARKLMVVTAAMALGVSVYAKDAPLKADAQAVNSACQADAATAGCGQEVVGKGMLKCMGAYKKAHQDFKVSDGCRDAMKQLNQDRKAAK